MDVKPCRVCGATNRGPGGKCRECAKAREERIRRANGIPKQSKYLGPCKKCGSEELNSGGDCRPCAIAYAKEYYRKNKEKMNKVSLAYARKNREKINALNRLFRKNNPEKVKEYGDKWRKNNPEKAAKTRADWIKNNKEYKRILTTNRRRKMASGVISKERIAYLLVKQNGKCPCCKCGLEKFHIDHIMPIALGGTNTDSNIQLLCPTCNLKKNAKHPVDFMQSLGYLI